MDRKRHKLDRPMDDGLGRDLMNAGRFCFSCEQIFSSRKCLEEHVCCAMSFICSCGTEFTEYKDMLEHSTTHEPGHQVLDHGTIKKRRMEKRKEEEEQLKRLETGEVVWKPPKVTAVPSVSLPVKPKIQVPSKPQVLKQCAKNSQVPKLYPPLSQASLQTNPMHSSSTEMKNIFADVGAPTVDLWTLYQPVVLLRMECKFNRGKPYICGKCGQCFVTKFSLISHHNIHVTDKVSGCIGCGLLLSSKKLVPRFHVCNSPSNATKFRIITARPNQVFVDRRRTESASRPQTTSYLEPKSLKQSPAGRVSMAPHAASTLQLKNLNFKKCHQNKRRLHVTPFSQLNSQNPSASQSRISLCLPAKRQSPNSFEFNINGNRLPVTPSRKLKTPINSASGVWGEPTKTSTAGFMCRVCHISFETAQLLQRHKCVKAREFMARHMHGSKQHYKLHRVTPVANLSPAQMNQQTLGIPGSGKVMNSQVLATDLDKGVVPVNCKMEVDIEDDCYIVEDEPDKPAEMIYQVTSSVPITT
ncbi:uncharacterized protein [Antennarius striatus]|uniref:uncharacterized protein n=1 Tax=Antennarius striatus TaxID=241820 RepID=UPI0035B25699